ncbi:hypothetical protein ABZV14_38425 [Streptosporangium canum]|uniref:hypothetical protein n=1 Tax=Streptosporangium canum TaxID=324952 RepID=UPI00339DBA13
MRVDAPGVVEAADRQAVGQRHPLDVDQLVRIGDPGGAGGDMADSVRAQRRGRRRRAEKWPAVTGGMSGIGAARFPPFEHRTERPEASTWVNADLQRRSKIGDQGT